MCDGLGSILMHLLRAPSSDWCSDNFFGPVVTFLFKTEQQAETLSLNLRWQCGVRHVDVYYHSADFVLKLLIVGSGWPWNMRTSPEDISAISLFSDSRVNPGAGSDMYLMKHLCVSWQDVSARQSNRKTGPDKCLL